MIHAAWTTASAGVRERADSFFGEMKLSDEETADGSLAFGRIDVNGDGRVEPRELPKSRALDSFAFIDLDGNGAWDTGEYTFIHDQEKFPGHNVMVAVEPGGLGNITDTHVKWRFNRGIPYVASPLVHDGRVYLVKAGGLLTVVDLETGKPAYRRTRLSDRSEYYATPLAVAGRILVCASGGTIYVLRADAELEIENEIELGERILATPAVVDDTLYLRSDRSLWAFGR